MGSKKLLSNSALGAADQAILSAFNLLIGLAFIKMATKSEYATFTLISTGLLLLQSLQNAIVSSPMSTLLPGCTEQLERTDLQAAFRRLQSGFVAAVSGTGTVIALLLFPFQHEWAINAIALAFGGLGVLSREYARTRYYLKQEAAAALLSDLGYVGIALIGLATLAYFDMFQAVPVLGIIGAAGLIVGLVQRESDGNVQPHALHRHRRAIWDCARWALPSVVNSWAYTYGYLFIVERLMSKAAVADLTASRLMLVPLSLVVVGWSSAFRPVAARLVADGKIQTVHASATKSALALVATSALYMLATWMVLPFLESWMLSEKYHGLQTLMCTWALYFTATAVRTVGMTAMLTHVSAFKPLFQYGLLASAIALPAVFLAANHHSLMLVLMALAASELILAALIWGIGWRKLRLQLIPTSNM